MIDLHEVPARKPPESPLAPQWYRLESKTGKGRVRGTDINGICAELGWHVLFHSCRQLCPNVLLLGTSLIILGQSEGTF